MCPGQKCNSITYLLSPDAVVFTLVPRHCANGSGARVWERSQSDMLAPLQRLPGHPPYCFVCLCRGERIHPVRHAEIYPSLWPRFWSHRAIASYRVAGSCGPGLWLWTQLLVLVWPGLGHHSGVSTVGLVVEGCALWPSSPAKLLPEWPKEMGIRGFKS